MSNKYYLYVHNTMTGKPEKVEVTKEVYIVYRRTEWNIEADNKKFYQNTISFSQLSGDDNETLDNFHEFLSNKYNPYEMLLNYEQIKCLNIAISSLKKSDREIIYALFFNGENESNYAKRNGITQQAINKKKQRILKKLKKLLKKGL